MPVASKMKLSTLLAAFALLASSCATPAGFKTANDRFRESSSDITNRAPTSLSVPPQVASGEQIDSLEMRAQADYHFTLAETHALEGNPARSVEEYKLTLVYDPNSSIVRLRLAQEYVKLGLVSEAMEQTKAALIEDPKLVEGYMLLGGLYSALRMYGDAVDSYRKAMSIDPENSEASMFIGALYAEQKRYPEALVQFEALAQNKNARSPHLAWYYVGRIHLEEGKPGAQEKAVVAFKKAIAAKPEFTDAILMLGQILESTAKSKEAKSLYARYQDEHGPDAGVAEALARLYLEEEEFDNAYRQFELIESRDQDDLNVKVKMAFILIEKKKFQEAILKLEDILTRAPDSDKIRFYLGAVYEEIKDYKSAIGHFRKIPVGSTYYAESIVHAAYLHKVLEDYDDAIKVVEQGIENQPDHAQFYALFASFLDDTKQWDRGVKMLSKAVSKFPENAQLYFFLGSMQDRVGKHQDTISSMRKVLEIEADHVQALNYLAYTYADKNLDLEEAESLARKALTLQPGDGYILDTLGWVLFKKGNVPEAIRTLEAAYKAQPKESIIAEHLGDAYYMQQLPDKAKRMYQRAMEIETDKNTLQKLRSKVVSIDKQQQSVGIDKGRQPASEINP